MENKKKFLKISLILCVSIISAILAEIFVFNYNYFIFKKYDNKNVEVLKTKNIKKVDNKYITTSNEESIIRIKNDNSYIDKIHFNYNFINQDDEDLGWKLDIDNIKTKNYVSSRILNKAIKKVRKKADVIELKFYKKNLEITNIQLTNKISFSFHRLFAMFILLFAAVTLFSFRNYFKENLHKAFLLLSLSLGFSLILVWPLCLYTSNDDQVHFSRSYPLLDGEQSKWNFSQRYFNRLIGNAQFRFTTVEEEHEYRKFLNKRENEVIIENVDSTIDYNDIVYLPLAVGFKIGRVLNLKFTHAIFLAKFLNLLVYSIIMAIAIKIIPSLKKLLVFFGLIPTNLALATSFSYDPNITALLALAFASFVRIQYDKKIDKKYIIILLISILLACFTKAIYAPLLALILLIPKDKFNDKKERNIINIATIIMFIIIFCVYIMPSLGEAGDARVSNTSVSGQLKYIFNNPLNYIVLMVKEFIYNFSNMFFGFETFSKFGYLTDESMKYLRLTNFITMVTLLYITFTSEIKKSIINKKLIVIFIIVLGTIWGLIWTALYLSWTPVGLNHINGVQSRYFLPILLYLLVLFIPKKVDNNEKYGINTLVLYFISFFVMFYNIMLIILKYHF